MNLSRKPKVFLSRTTKGLGSIAGKVAEVLEEKGFEVVHQPEFGMGWRRIRHMLMDKIRDCDSVLCLVGSAYGFAPSQPIAEFADPDTGRTEFSYTQIEYLLARRLHKPIITVLLVESFPCESVTQSDDEKKLQSDFVQHYILKDEHLFQGYATEDALIDALRRADIPLTTSLLPPAVPENIPFKSIGTLFTGRENDLLALRESLLAAGQTGGKKRPVQVIHGLGGVGKTRLAVEFAHVNGEEYTACLYVRGASPRALEDSIAHLCGLFILNLEEQDEKETEIRVQAVLRWLEAHPGYLLVIDNVDTEEARDAVLEIIPRLRNGHVLITSRLHTWPGDILRLSLEVLSDSDGAALLLGYRSSPKMPADTDPADALALSRDLDGLALALEQAAAYLNSIACTVAEYHELWKRNSRRVHEWHDSAQMGYPASVATTWQTSFDQLNPTGQSLLCLLSWLAPDPVPNTLLGALDEQKSTPNPLGGISSRKALGEILNFSLAKPVSGGRAFTVHRLVQQITRERQPAPPPPEQKPAAQPAGFLKRLFSGKEDVSRPTPATAAPPALLTSLGWVSAEFGGHSDDVRSWPVLGPLLPHALAVAGFGADQRIPDPSARLLSVAALLLHAQANHRAAEPLFRRALAIDEAAYGESHPNVASDLGNLGQLLAETDRGREAEPLMRRALAIDEACFGKKHPKVSGRLNNLAQLLAQTDRIQEAGELTARALAIDEAWFGPEHPNVAIRLSNLAQIIAEMGRFREAEPLMQRALAIDEKCLGTEQPNVAIRLNNLGQLLQSDGRLDEAELLMVRALAIDEAAYGKEHPNVAIRLGNLAQLFVAKNRMRDAEPLMRRALSIDEQYYYPIHPRIAVDLDNLARLLQTTDRPAEAEPLISRVLAIDEHRLGQHHPKVAADLSNLAKVLLSTNQAADAEPSMCRALEIYKRNFGPDDPKVARASGDLAQLLQDGNRLEEAESLMRRVLQIDEKNFGPNNPEVAADLSDLALLLKAASRTIDAEPLMRRALKIDLESYPPDHPIVVMDLKNLSQLLLCTNRPTEAESLMRRAMQIDEQRYGSDYLDVGVDCSILAKCLQSNNRLSEAEPLMRRALEIAFLNSLPSDRKYSHLRSRIEDYAQLLSAIGRPEDQIRALISQICPGLLHREGHTR